MFTTARLALLPLILAGMISSGCSYTLPLGGISTGQARPSPRGSIQAGFSIGMFPDLAGSVPEIRRDETVYNPIDSAGTTEGGWGFLGLGGAVGITNWLDMGYNTSRGLYSTARILAMGPWALSVTPAYYRFVRSERRDEMFSDPSVWTRVENLNLTGLLAYREEIGPFNWIDVYAGGGYNRYTVTIRDQWREFEAGAPTLLLGVMLEGSPDRQRGGRLALEAAGTWLTQRDGREKLVVTGRFQLAVSRGLLW
jgi:hypothetical protein